MKCIIFENFKNFEKVLTLAKIFINKNFSYLGNQTRCSLKEIREILLLLNPVFL